MRPSRVRPHADLHVHGLALAVRTLRMAESARMKVFAALGSALDRRLSPEQKELLSLALYTRRGPTSSELFSWERDWFERRLPGPRSRVLVGGAGEGREVFALERRGFRVDAFDPSIRALDLLPSAHRKVAQASYADLDPGLSGVGPLKWLQGRRYDAMLFGWGSFAHLLTDVGRLSALRAAARLTDGPILLSVPRVAQRATENAFTVWSGFIRPLSDEELRTYAHALSRRAGWEPQQGYAHATLHPTEP